MWKVEYEARFADAWSWAVEHDVRPSARDKTRVCLLVVDAQHVLHAGFELFVAGRSRPGPSTTTGVSATSSTATSGGSPRRSLRSTRTRRSRSSTPCSSSTRTAGTRSLHARDADAVAGRWRSIRAAATLDLARGRAPADVRRDARGRRGSTTSRSGRSTHARRRARACSAVEEALFFHADRAQLADALRDQGRASADRALLGARAGGPAGARRAARVAERGARRAPARLRRRPRRRAGEEPLRRLDGRRPARDVPEIAPRLYLLEDCSSPVVVPGIDYTGDADAAFARFEEAGAHVVRSTEPIASWPGPPAAAAVS